MSEQWEKAGRHLEVGAEAVAAVVGGVQVQVGGAKAVVDEVVATAVREKKGVVYMSATFQCHATKQTWRKHSKNSGHFWKFGKPIQFHVLRSLFFEIRMMQKMQ